MTTRSKTKDCIKLISGKTEVCSDDVAEVESKKVLLTNVLRELSYFIKSTGEILKQNSRELLTRQYTLLNTRINEV